MRITRRDGLRLLAAAAAVAGPFRASAMGAVHEVQMLNKHPETGERMVFVPDLIRAAPGDTIRFVAADRGHNSASNKDMLPEGAEGWKGRVSKDVEVVVDAEGAYGFHCVPHLALGMVGLILVGDPSSNFEAARAAKHRSRKAKARYEDIFARAEALLASEA